MSQVPSEKMVLGVPIYGRSFKLKDNFDSCPLTGIFFLLKVSFFDLPLLNHFKYLDTPVAGPGTAGRFTREAGFLGNIFF